MLSERQENIKTFACLYTTSMVCSVIFIIFAMSIISRDAKIDINNLCIMQGFDILMMLIYNLVMFGLSFGFVLFIYAKNCFNHDPIFDYYHINLYFPLLALTIIIIMLINLCSNHCAIYLQNNAEKILMYYLCHFLMCGIIILITMFAFIIHRKKSQNLNTNSS